MGVVGLHLHALAEVHEGFVDFACFGEGGAGGFGGAGAFGAWMAGLAGGKKDLGECFWLTYQRDRQSLACCSTTVLESQPDVSSSPQCRRSRGCES